jgi:hypothetical protein
MMEEIIHMYFKAAFFIGLYIAAVAIARALQKARR